MSHDAFALISGDFPFHWADPSAWPWFIWMWLAIVLGAQVKPVWRWFRRRQAAAWPTITGRIDSVRVKPQGDFPFSNSSRARARAFTAVLEYAYSLEGNSYLGNYQRDFATEVEAREFVRDLQGKTVIVARNPRNPANSLLTEDSVSAVLASRPPAPEGKFQVRVPGVPSWVKPLLWPFVALSAVGLGLSLWVHLGAVAGQKVAPEAFFWVLHVGIFVVWFPAVIVAQKRVGNTRRKDFWKLVLKGSPEWMRYMVYGFLGYAMVNFALFISQAPQGGGGQIPSAIEWRRFSGHWMAFYSAALAILYTAANAPQDSCT